VAEQFARPALELPAPQLGDLNVAASPSAGQGMALDDKGHIPVSLTRLHVVLVTRTTATNLNAGSFGTVAGETEAHDDWNGYTVGDSLVTVDVSGRYAVTFFMLMSGGTITSTTTSGRINHLDTSSGLIAVVGQAYTAAINQALTVSAVVECAATEKIQFQGMTGASGTAEQWVGRYSVTKLATP
jgi:hypothetical protein